MERFREGYGRTVESAMEGTGHEVSINREIDELFALLHGFPEAEIAPRLLGKEKPVHEPLIGFDATTPDGAGSIWLTNRDSNGLQWFSSANVVALCPFGGGTFGEFYNTLPISVLKLTQA